MKIFRRLRQRVRPHHLVFRVGNRRLYLTGRILLFIKIHFFQAVLYHGFRVRRVVNDEILSVPVQRVNLISKQPRAEGMECAEPYVFGGAADKTIHALPHLRRRFVCKRDCENPVRSDAVRQKIRDAASQHFRLSRAGPRHDEERPRQVLDCLSLHRIQCVQYIVQSQFSSFMEKAASRTMERQPSQKFI